MWEAYGGPGYIRGTSVARLDERRILAVYREVFYPHDWNHNFLLPVEYLRLKIIGMEESEHFAGQPTWISGETHYINVRESERYVSGWPIDHFLGLDGWVFRDTWLEPLAPNIVLAVVRLRPDLTADIDDGGYEKLIAIVIDTTREYPVLGPPKVILSVYHRTADQPSPPSEEGLARRLFGGGNLDPDQELNFSAQSSDLQLVRIDANRAICAFDTTNRLLLTGPMNNSRARQAHAIPIHRSGMTITFPAQAVSWAWNEASYVAGGANPPYTFMPATWTNHLSEAMVSGAVTHQGRALVQLIRREAGNNYLPSVMHALVDADGQLLWETRAMDADREDRLYPEGEPAPSNTIIHAGLRRIRDDFAVSFWAVRRADGGSRLYLAFIRGSGLPPDVSPWQELDTDDPEPLLVGSYPGDDHLLFAWVNGRYQVLDQQLRVRHDGEAITPMDTVRAWEKVPTPWGFDFEGEMIIAVAQFRHPPGWEGSTRIGGYRVARPTEPPAGPAERLDSRFRVQILEFT